MIAVREAAARGSTLTGWLESRHSFSFGEFHDPAQMGFGVLRVLNDDVIAGGAGFPPHSHANMEILSFVVSGALAHRDNQGGGATLGAGDVQWMSAGHGIRHSEFNGEVATPTRFIQIWIQPNVLNAAPAYADRHFAAADRTDRWCLVAAPQGVGGSLPIRQDARVHVAELAAGRALDQDLTPGRRAWLQVVTGGIDVNGHPLNTGDGAAITGESLLALRATAASSLILLDLP